MMNWNWLHFKDLNTDQLHSIMCCRQEVFIVEQSIKCVDCDELDKISWHLFAENENEEIAAYLRVIPAGFKYPEVSIGRVLTMPKYRKIGLGKELIQQACLQIEKQLETRIIKISAQKYLEKFYSDLEFKVISDTYLEEGIEHIKMLRE